MKLHCIMFSWIIHFYVSLELIEILVPLLLWKSIINCYFKTYNFFNTSVANFSTRAMMQKNQINQIIILGEKKNKNQTCMSNIALREFRNVDKTVPKEKVLLQARPPFCSWIYCWYLRKNIPFYFSNNHFRRKPAVFLSSFL